MFWEAVPGNRGRKRTGSFEGKVLDSWWWWGPEKQPSQTRKCWDPKAEKCRVKAMEVFEGKEDEFLQSP